MPSLALVIDDSLVVRHVLRRFLEQRGFTVETVSDGAEALKLLETVRPHVIFTDLHMPRLDGHRLMEILKADPNLSAIPLVVLSAKPLPKTKSAPGAAQFLIAKDLNIETQLKQILEELQPLLPGQSAQSE
jgi:CheY-like chemotaxis protein